MFHTVHTHTCYYGKTAYHHPCLMAGELYKLSTIQGTLRGKLLPW